MHEYPPGSGNFMSIKDMIEARNAAARLALQKPAQPETNEAQDEMSVGGQPETNAIAGNKQRNNIMVSPTGNLSDIPEEDRWNPL